MQLTFQIDFVLDQGQELCIVGNLLELGEGNEEHALVLSSHENGICTQTITVSTTTTVQYRYFLRHKDGTTEYECGEQRTITLPEQQQIFVRDYWRMFEQLEKTFSTSFFKQLVVKRQTNTPLKKQNILFRVYAPHIKENETLCIVGEHNILGNWNTNKALPLSATAYPYWSVPIAIEQKIASDYKYIIRNEQTKEILWENGENRSMQTAKGFSLFNDEHLQFEKKQWKGAGISIPVFSLRTREGFGVGEFPDLKKMADWASSCGLQVIQILPVNDTIAQRTYADSYPYNPISSFALHPIYLHLPDVVREYCWADKQDYQWRQKILNTFPTVDYENVVEQKLHYLRSFFEERCTEIIADKEFQAFVEEKETWLYPYAVFCYFRDKTGTVDFDKWGKFSRYKRNEIDTFLKSNTLAKKTVLFYSFLQYHLNKQLSEAVTYAHQQGVVFKGDVPIGVGRYSADVWQYPHLFDTTVRAGAPPDDFSKQGQNWGFPTYKWEIMETDRYKWWKERFSYMANYFDAYRIDHILGFFRIWAIPYGAIWGILGYFHKALPYCIEDIRKYGINLDVERYCMPCITSATLTTCCGTDAEIVKSRFLEPLDNATYTLKKSLNTQQKIVDFFAQKSPEITDTVFQEYLMALAAEVLFIKEGKEAHCYHPCISLQHTFLYHSLEIHEREALLQLHDDFFYHRHNDFWKQQAETKLKSLVQTTPMLACGEDLGMLPDSVAAVMQTFEILSLEIERMPKQYGVRYTNLSRLPYLSVCTTGTHDMSPVRLWWEEENENIATYFHEILQQQGEIPQKATTTVCKQILWQHLTSSSILAIFPLQDWLAISPQLRNTDIESERINIPSNPHHYWKYRMHLFLEDLLEADDLSNEIRELVQQSGRS